VRVRGTVAYDGTPFHGFAANAGVRTVAGDLDAALSRVLGTELAVTCAGRTDRGVHAVGQVVSFDAPEGTDLDAVRRSVNRLCGPEIVVSSLDAATDGFDARFSATGRRYRYRVRNHPDPDPFSAATAWHVPQPLDVAAMNAAAGHLVGEHDFSSFCRRPKVAAGEPERSLVRRVESAEWTTEGDDVVFEVTAGAFCHQMVRSIVGTLVDVGRGRTPAAAVPAVLAARDRHAAGEPAPPHGLTLWSVRYPDSAPVW